MFSVIFRIQERNWSIIRDLARTENILRPSRSFRQIPIWRPYSTLEGVGDSIHVKTAENTSKGEVGGGDRSTLFVGRLPHGVEPWPLRAKLWELFQPFGKITSIKVGEPYTVGMEYGQLN